MWLRPSEAYVPSCLGPDLTYCIQNKKRKFDRDRDERESKDRREEEAADPLKDATTLYVGNLYVVSLPFVRTAEQTLRVITGHSTPPRSKYMSCLQSELSANVLRERY